MRWGARLRSPWIAAGLTVTVGIAATIVAFVARVRREDLELRADLAHRASVLARAVEERFGGPVESMRAVASLITATGEARGDA
ncbi:MAG TPA: hypothetical protein VL463_12075, partial [Kofleriaceae bacterium]|nr:hypothetical protein [Kofleriaceae bacterium]